MRTVEYKTENNKIKNAILNQQTITGGQNHFYRDRFIIHLKNEKFLILLNVSWFLFWIFRNLFSDPTVGKEPVENEISERKTCFPRETYSTFLLFLHDSYILIDYYNKISLIFSKIEPIIILILAFIQIYYYLLNSDQFKSLVLFKGAVFIIFMSLITYFSVQLYNVCSALKPTVHYCE